LPEIRLTERHARRGYQVYPIRLRPVDEGAREEGPAASGPWADVAGMEHLADHDAVFGAFAAHPNLVGLLPHFISPNLHPFVFAPVCSYAPSGGANPLHQDGFVEFSDRSATCWLALDEVTTENGCLRYLPETCGYGQFKFDQLADGITARELDAEVLVPLHPGDGVFHDRWCIHATGPNETPRGRRGWAVHYTSAKSRFVYDPTFTAMRYVQTPDGRHYRD